VPENIGFAATVILVILLSISVHEFAHAKMADLSGDDTPRLMGRVTLVPWKHWDPIGTIMIIFTSIVGVGIGWGKPVIARAERMRNPRWDMFWTVAAGPISNFLIAGVAAVLLRVALAGPFGENGLAVAPVLLVTVLANIGLGLFNLIPLGPLDGHWLVGAFLPEPARQRWYHFNRTIGGFLLLGLVFLRTDRFDPLGMLLGPVRERVAQFLLGT
jgi:Zn-dependent protease